MSRDSRRESGNIAAVYIGKIKAKSKKPWRWDIYVYRMDSGEYPGVHNVATHVTSYCGYQKTYLGALCQVGKALKKVK